MPVQTTPYTTSLPGIADSIPSAQAWIRSVVASTDRSTIADDVAGRYQPCRRGPAHHVRRGPLAPPRRYAPVRLRLRGHRDDHDPQHDRVLIGTAGNRMPAIPSSPLSGTRGPHRLAPITDSDGQRPHTRHPRMPGDQIHCHRADAWPSAHFPERLPARIQQRRRGLLRLAPLPPRPRQVGVQTPPPLGGRQLAGVHATPRAQSRPCVAEGPVHADLIEADVRAGERLTGVRGGSRLATRTACLIMPRARSRSPACAAV